MNSIKLSATSFGASIKKECLYFGKITNLEFPSKARWPLDSSAPFLKGPGLKF